MAIIAFKQMLQKDIPFGYFLLTLEVLWFLSIAYPNVLQLNGLSLNHYPVLVILTIQQANV